MLAEVLSLAHHCLLGPDHGELRGRLAEELVGQAVLTGRRGDLLMGLLWRTVDLILAASPYAERSLRELTRALEARQHLAVGFVVSAMEVMLSIRAGRFKDAEALAATCAERGDAAGDVDATGWYGGQLAAIRWFQGRGAELVPVLSELVNSPTFNPVDHSYVASLAAASAAAGDRRTAEGLLARLRGADLPRSSTWLTSMYFMVECAYLLRDADTAAHAYAALAPYAGLPVIAGPGVTCFGSTHHSLGLASLILGEADRAVGHLRAAVWQNLALGHWPATVLSRHRLGQALALRHEPNGEERAAAREAEELGMVLPEAVERVAGRAGLFLARRSGLHWRFELDGRAVLGHSVGMGYLAMLMADPGREIPAIDLAAGADTVRSVSASEQPVLDGEARRTYKERARPFAGSEERARIAVSKAIRRAVARIAEADPVLGDELKATVRTGSRCAYHPR